MIVCIMITLNQPTSFAAGPQRASFAARVRYWRPSHETQQHEDIILYDYVTCI